MDSTALSLCMENHLPVVVFNLRSPDSIARAAAGEGTGTRVGDLETTFAAASAATT
jgi:uridylate kinase